jgi:hypothetical protein
VSGIPGHRWHRGGWLEVYGSPTATPVSCDWREIALCNGFRGRIGTAAHPPDCDS